MADEYEREVMRRVFVLHRKGTPPMFSRIPHWRLALRRVRLWQGHALQRLSSWWEQRKKGFRYPYHFTLGTLLLIVLGVSLFCSLGATIGWQVFIDCAIKILTWGDR